MSFEIIIADYANKRMVNRLFVDIKRDTMEVYGNDMVVKSKVGVKHQRYLEWAFEGMKLQNIWPNPSN